MPTPTTLAASDVALNAIQGSVFRTFQRKAFFALGRHWVFYVDDGGSLVYDSSVGDTGIWLGPAAFKPANDGSEFSVFMLETNPTTAHVHTIWADSTGNSEIEYQRGTLAADGTIAWDAPDTAVPLDIGYEYENLGICMGFDGFIYIVYTKVETADPNKCTPYVCQSITSDGTWTTGAGYPLQITAVEDASWVPLVAPYGTEVIVVYTVANGDILSRLLSGGVWGIPVDTGFDIGNDAQKISIVSETIRSGLAAPSSRAVYVAYQAADWDLYSIRYESLAWQGAPANRIQTIGAFREASPMLSILDTGDSDDDHGPATLYCFWTPTTDSPLAEWVTYRVSRDLGDTWTNEAGADAAVSWINETVDGFEIQASGSAYYHSSSDYDRGKFHIGVVYVVHRMPPALRHAGLEFDDPAVNLHGEFMARHGGTADLAAEFIVRQGGPQIGEDLLGEFIVRHVGTPVNLPAEFIVSRMGDVELHGEFIVQQRGDVDLHCQFEVGQGAVDLPGEFIAQHADSQDLPAQFFVRNGGTEDLHGEFVIRRSATVNLLCEFIVRQADAQDLPAHFRIDVDFISKGLNVSVYRDLGVIG